MSWDEVIDEPGPLKDELYDYYGNVRITNSISGAIFDLKITGQHVDGYSSIGYLSDKIQELADTLSAVDDVEVSLYRTSKNWYALSLTEEEI